MASEKFNTRGIQNTYRVPRDTLAASFWYLAMDLRGTIPFFLCFFFFFARETFPAKFTILQKIRARGNVIQFAIQYFFPSDLNVLMNFLAWQAFGVRLWRRNEIECAFDRRYYRCIDDGKREWEGKRKEQSYCREWLVMINGKLCIHIGRYISISLHN